MQKKRAMGSQRSWSLESFSIFVVAAMGKFNGVRKFNGVGPSEQTDFILKRLNFDPQNSLKHPFWGTKRAV
jgi:hypothetical protein